ncbi:MAG: GntR family transcriptional regulator [Clostridiaceae bacterium]|nr:GntR family transcriptional regulator [Clostridiaceae bacterium]
MRIVSKVNPLPLYYQLKEILQEMIENEELKPGDMIPAERELCEIQCVSRMTVNKAIMYLVNEDIIYREQGKGTFVSAPKEKQQISKLKGFTEEMEDKGVKSQTKILSFKLKPATKQIKTILEIEDRSTQLIEIKRLRLSNDEPLAIETVWLPHHLFNDMTTSMIEGKSLYSIFREKYGLYPIKAKQTIEPIILSEYECNLLNQKPHSIALMFKRTTYTQDGTPIEYTNSIYRSDRYKYEIILE